MAIVKCPECNGKVSSVANTCPHCGFNMDATIVADFNGPAPKKSVSPALIIIIVLLSVMLGALIVFLLNHSQKPVQPASEPEPIVESRSLSLTDIGKKDIDFTGVLGGDSNSSLTLHEMKGELKFTTYTRKLNVTSYNTSTGELMIEARSTSNDYVGVFNGKVSLSNDGRLHYKGTFTNYKFYTLQFDYSTMSSSK